MSSVPPPPKTWDEPGLRASGFEGFVRFGDLAVTRPPEVAGIYAIIRSADAPAQLLSESTAKWRAGRDPAYDLADLESRWIDGVRLVYLGKANSKRGLRQRLGQFASRATNHHGGRSIWQLADQDDLLVSWMPTPDVSAREVEEAWLAAFKAEHGGWPFANRRA